MPGAAAVASIDASHSDDLQETHVMDATIADVEPAQTRSPDTQQPALTAGALRPAEELAAEAVARAADRAAAPVAQSFTVAGPSITVGWHDIPSRPRVTGSASSSAAPRTGTSPPGRTPTGRPTAAAT